MESWGSLQRRICSSLDKRNLFVDQFSNELNLNLNLAWYCTLLLNLPKTYDLLGTTDRLEVHSILEIHLLTPSHVVEGVLVDIAKKMTH
jgi:hypothetical protein